jgi:CheY-like chemotaxis protein/HPt (histidine-containing phosphotransfer) domain-containing protein
MHAALRILLVEDNPDALRFFTEILKISGYAVDAARDGAEATQKALTSRYDLIATDLELPKRTGLDVITSLRELEAREQRAATPVIVITAQDRADVRARALELGANAFLGKPVRSRELVSTVRAHIDDRTAVLIVDDAEPSRELIEAWLAQRPRVRAISVDRAGAAIACVKRERVDLVLLDMVMPGIDGYAAVRLLRAVPDARAVPIVAMTAKTGDEERAACLDAGCSDYIPKPLERTGLLQLIDRLARPERATGTSLRPPPRPVSPRPATRPLDENKRTRIEELDPDSAALVPAYLEKRKEELAVLEDALATRAFDTLYRLGHNLRGSGGSYGFPYMTELGEQMERAAKANDGEAVARAIAQLREHLSEVLRARGA